MIRFKPRLNLGEPLKLYHFMKNHSINLLDSHKFMCVSEVLRHTYSEPIFGTEYPKGIQA